MKTCYLLLKALAATVGVLVALAGLCYGYYRYDRWAMARYGDPVGDIICILPALIWMAVGTMWFFYGRFSQKAGKEQ